MTPDFSADHFALFGLAAAFRMDGTALDRAWRELQAQVHPDRYAHAGEAEKRLSMQWATRVNEAYQTLKEPLRRADYLLQKRGIHALGERQTALPADFLMQQMEWREALHEAQQVRDAHAIEQLRRALKREAAGLTDLLARQLDEERAWDAAADTVRKLRFVQKLAEDVNLALAGLEEDD